MFVANIICPERVNVAEDGVNNLFGSQLRVADELGKIKLGEQLDTHKKNKNEQHDLIIVFPNKY